MPKLPYTGQSLNFFPDFASFSLIAPFCFFYQGEYACYFFIDIALYKYYYGLFGFWEHSNGLFYLHRVDQIAKVTVSTISLCVYSTLIFFLSFYYCSSFLNFDFKIFLLNLQQVNQIYQLVTVVNLLLSFLCLLICFLWLLFCT